MSVLFLHHPKETDLALFAGGELGPLARWRIERHIQSCADCEEAVADFFHLQGDVSELAELPPVDWNALSLSVRQAVAEARANPEPVKGGGWHRPLVWQAGLASAALFCAFVVVRQYSAGPDMTAVGRVALEQHENALNKANANTALMETDSVAAADRDAAPAAQLSGAREGLDAPAEPLASGPAGGRSIGLGAARFDDRAQSAEPSRDAELAEGNAADGRKLIAGAEFSRALNPAPQPALPGDVGARSAPVRPDGATSLVQPAGKSAAPEAAAGEKAEESPALTLALARRNAPPVAPPPVAEPTANQRRAETESFRARETQKSQAVADAAAPSAFRAEMKAAPEAETLADRGAGQQVAPSIPVGMTTAEYRQPIAPAAGPGFSVPSNAGGGPRLDTAVAADGGISYRSVDSRTGTITIYDVYVP